MLIPLLCHKADAYAEVGIAWGIERMHLISGIKAVADAGDYRHGLYLAGVNMVGKGFFWMPFQNLLNMD